MEINGCSSFFSNIFWLEIENQKARVKITFCGKFSFRPFFHFLIFVAFFNFFVDTKSFSLLYLEVSSIVYKCFGLIRLNPCHYICTCWAFNVIVVCKLFFLFVTSFLDPLGWFIAWYCCFCQLAGHKIATTTTTIITKVFIFSFVKAVWLKEMKFLEEKVVLFVVDTELKINSLYLYIFVLIWLYLECFFFSFSFTVPNLLLF